MVGEVVTKRPRWLAVVAVFVVFAIGVGVGAAVSETEEADQPPVASVDTVAFACDGQVMLVLNATDLPADTYELRIMSRDGTALMTHETTAVLVGKQHPRSVVPADGGLLLVVAVPPGTDGRILYELVGTNTNFAEGAPLLSRPLQACPDE